MKKLLFSLGVLVVMLISVTAYAAAPEEIKSEDKGNAEDLVVLSDFAEDNNSVTTSDNILSGSGQEGVTVTLYVKESESEIYHKIKQEEKSDNTDTYEEKDLSFVIGASGLFMQELELKDGENYLAIYAEKDDNNQIIKFNINKLKEDYKSFLEKMTVNIKDELKKLIGPDSQ